MMLQIIIIKTEENITTNTTCLKKAIEIKIKNICQK